MSSVYRGAALQRGHGIGSFLGGLIRTVAPLIRTGVLTLGKEVLRSGVGFLGDIAAGASNPRVVAKARLKQLTGMLKRKADDKLDRVMSDGGSYKKRRIQRVIPQSLAKLLETKTTSTKKKKKKTVAQRKKKRSNTEKDIFG